MLNPIPNWCSESFRLFFFLVDLSPVNNEITNTCSPFDILELQPGKAWVTWCYSKTTRIGGYNTRPPRDGDASACHTRSFALHTQLYMMTLCTGVLTVLPTRRWVWNTLVQKSRLGPSLRSKEIVGRVTSLFYYHQVQRPSGSDSRNRWEPGRGWKDGE